MSARRWFWRLSRRAYYRARRDLLHNAIARNGEADLQRRVAANVAAAGRDELIAVDVGANLGEWTISMLDAARGAGVAARVHAFEPVPAVHDELEQRVAIDPDGGRVTLVRECVGSEPGTAHMQLAEGLAGTHSLVRAVGAGETVEVPVTTLDAYCEAKGIAHVDLLKIDAEGVDFEVILGARRLLETGRVDVLQFEYNACWIDARRFLKDVFALSADCGGSPSRNSSQAVPRSIPSGTPNSSASSRPTGCSAVGTPWPPWEACRAISMHRIRMRRINLPARSHPRRSRTSSCATGGAESPGPWSARGRIRRPGT